MAAAEVSGLTIVVMNLISTAMGGLIAAGAVVWAARTTARSDAAARRDARAAAELDATREHLDRLEEALGALRTNSFERAQIVLRGEVPSEAIALATTEAVVRTNALAGRIGNDVLSLAVLECVKAYVDLPHTATTNDADPAQKRSAVAAATVSQLIGEVWRGTPP